MRFEKQGENTHIFVEGDETEVDVLRAIAKASFKLARPVGLGIAHHVEDLELTDEQADMMVDPNRGVGIKCDYLQGRQVVTRVARVSEGHFEFDDYIFERDRGTVVPMLELVQALLRGETDAVASSTPQYQGQALDNIVGQFQITRQEGESDWQLRQRAFPPIYPREIIFAIRILMGINENEWDEADRAHLKIIKVNNVRSFEWLCEFADGFPRDPVLMRQDRHALDAQSSK